MEWILITGAGKGLGSAIALALAEKGHHLVLHYNQSKKEVYEVASKCQEYGIKADCIHGDFASQEGLADFITRYLKDYGDTYGLVHNIGNYLIKPLSDTTLEEWDSLFQSNLFSYIHLLNALSDPLKKNQGRVVTIGTIGLSQPRAYKKAPAYSVSKSALYQTSLSYAKEWVKEGVTVNMVSPGYMENAVDLGEAILPLGRPASLQEVSRLVAFLCARENGYITGQNIEISGGFGL